MPEEIEKEIIEAIEEAIYAADSVEDAGLKRFSNEVHACLADSLAFIRQLESELEAVKQERDAAVKDIEYVISEPENPLNDCMVCKYKDRPICESCEWEWRGVCPENTEVQGDD